MISLDQVLLLEEKVESAVAKIQQLEAENDALRNKCSELTNALSAKTEQLASYESEQNKIESGIIKAIDRLNSIENSVLKAAGSIPAKETAVPEPVEGPAQEAVTSGLAAAAAKVAETQAEPVSEEPTPTPSPATEMSFDQMTPVEEAPVEEVAPFEEEIIDESDAIDQAFEETSVEEPIEEETEEDSDPDSKDQLGFDIF